MAYSKRKRRALDRAFAKYEAGKIDRETLTRIEERIMESPDGLSLRDSLIAILLLPIGIGCLAAAVACPPLIFPLGVVFYFAARKFVNTTGTGIGKFLAILLIAMIVLCVALL